MLSVKKQILLLSSLLILSQLCFSQVKSNLISWSSVNRLSSAQFKLGAPEEQTERSLGHGRKSVLEGYIFTGIDYHFRQENKTINFSVESFMNPEKSWLRDTSDAGTLEHEQAHFDFTEIYSRKMRKAMSSVKNAQAAKRIYEQYFRELQEEQKRFDAAHHGETGLEPSWRKKINGELSDLDKWSSTSIEINLK